MRQRVILVVICIVALAGFFLPAATVRLSFLGVERTANFSLATPFENNDSPFGGRDGGFHQSDLLDLVDLDIFDMRDDIGGRMIRAVASYLAAFVLALAVAILLLLGKCKKASLLLHLLAIGLLIYAGRTITTVPDMLFERIEDLLGFFAMFLNIRGMLQVNLSMGYWVSLVGLAILLVARVVIAGLTRNLDPGSSPG